MAFGGMPTAAAADEWDNCAKRSGGDRAIAACSRAIASGRWHGHDLAGLYDHRGLHYREDKDDVDRAMADHEQAIRIDPKYMPAYINRGAVWYDKGDNDRAIADYNMAIQIKPDEPLAYFNRGQAWLKKGDQDRAIADYTEAIRLDPKYDTAYFRRAGVRSDKGDSDNAIADYNEAIRLDPRWDVAYALRGILRHQKGDFDGAIADQTEAIRLDPKFTFAYTSRCWTRAVAGKLPQALVDCNEALRLAPDNVLAMDMHALVQFKSGAFDSAIADYSAALEKEPKSAYSLYGRGFVKIKNGDRSGGEADIAAATAIDPKIVDLWTRESGITDSVATDKTVVAYNDRCQANIRKGNYDQAVADCSQAIQLDPKLAFAYSNRCWARAIIGRELSQALADCDQALRLYPDYSNAFGSRGLVLLKLDAFDRAITDYSAVLDKEPKDAYSLYGRGTARIKSGNQASGEADIAAAKAIEPTIANEFALYGVKADVVVKVTEKPPAVPPADCAQAETHWKSVEEIKTLAAYQDHLTRFPNCAFEALAKLRIDALRK
jgi:tetratricopeptide (TPR) repeat protein